MNKRSVRQKLRLPAADTACIPALLTFCLLVLLTAGGCADLSQLTQPNLKIESYTIEVSLPEKSARTLPCALRIRQFTTNPLYATSAMVYKTKDYQTAAYTYHRWHIPPTGITAAALHQSLRAAGICRAVFGPDAVNPADYWLDGHLETFLENDTVSPWQAELALVVTLVDADAAEPRRQVLLQKRYTATEPCVRDTPRALAEAMSRALETVTAEIITDVTARLAEIENQSGTDLSPE